MTNILLIRSRAIDPGIYKIANALAEGGYHVSLLLWDRGEHIDLNSATKYKIFKFNLKAPHDTISLILYLPFWWIYETIFLLSKPFTVIHTCDFDTILPALLIKKIRKCNLCYTIFDFYADNLPFNTPNIIKNFIAYLEKKSIEFTDLLFLVDEARYKQIEGSKIRSLVYIYNSPPDLYHSFRIQNKDDGGIITIFYAGVLHSTRGLTDIVYAIKDLEDIHLIIAGTGPEYLVLQNLQKVLQIQFDLLGWIPYEKVIKYSLNADILFAFYNPVIPNNRYASPNKLFEAMMCKKPIIVNDGTTMADIVRKDNCGSIVPYGDVEAIKYAILTLKNAPTLRKHLGENGRRAYETKYNWKIMKERLLKAYSQFA